MNLTRIATTLRHWIERTEGTRFLVAASIAALVNLGTLYLLADIFGVPYLAGSIAAFIVGFAVAFALHKWWTFREPSREQAPRQLLLSAVLKLINFATYVGLIYVGVEWIGLWHMYAAIIGGAAIPVENFLAFKYVIFRREHP